MVGNRAGNVSAADTILDTLGSLQGEMREAIATGDMVVLSQLDQQRQDVIAAALPDQASTRHIKKLARLIEEDRLLQEELTALMQRSKAHHVSRMRAVSKYRR